MMTEHDEERQRLGILSEWSVAQKAGESAESFVKRINARGIKCCRASLFRWRRIFAREGLWGLRDGRHHDGKAKSNMVFVPLVELAKRIGCSSRHLRRLSPALATQGLAKLATVVPGRKPQWVVWEGYQLKKNATSGNAAIGVSMAAGETGTPAAIAATAGTRATAGGYATGTPVALRLAGLVTFIFRGMSHGTIDVRETAGGFVVEIQG
jgi:hypothetical protein